MASQDPNSQMRSCPDSKSVEQDARFMEFTGKNLGFQEPRYIDRITTGTGHGNFGPQIIQNSIRSQFSRYPDFRPVYHDPRFLERAYQELRCYPVGLYQQPPRYPDTHDGNHPQRTFQSPRLFVDGEQQRQHFRPHGALNSGSHEMENQFTRPQEPTFHKRLLRNGCQPLSNPTNQDLTTHDHDQQYPRVDDQGPAIQTHQHSTADDQGPAIENRGHMQSRATDHGAKDGSVSDVEIPHVKSKGREPRQVVAQKSDNFSSGSKCPEATRNGDAQKKSAENGKESRLSYFLSINVPSSVKHSSSETKEPRKATPASKKTPSLAGTKESRGVASSQTRKDQSRDDCALLLTPKDAPGFVRGGIRRSLQLPKDRPTVPGRLLPSTGQWGSRNKITSIGETVTGSKNASTRQRLKEKEATKPGDRGTLSKVLSTPTSRTNIKEKDGDKAKKLEDIIHDEDIQKIDKTMDGRDETTEEKFFLEDGWMGLQSIPLEMEVLMQDLRSSRNNLEWKGLEDSSDEQRKGEQGRIFDSSDDQDRDFGSVSSITSSQDQRSKALLQPFVRSSGRPTSAGSIKGRSSGQGHPLKPSTTTCSRNVLPGISKSTACHGNAMVMSCHGNTACHGNAVTSRRRAMSENDDESNEYIGNNRPNGNFTKTSAPLTAKSNSHLANHTRHRKTTTKDDRLQSTPVRQRAPVRQLTPVGKLTPGAFDDRDTDTASEHSDTLSAFSNGSTLMTDVLINLASSSAVARKEGLSDFQYLLRSAALPSKKDVRRLTEIFTRMFHEPQTKVFSLFLEVLVEFVQCPSESVEEWLPICLNRLLTKLGTDLLGSVQLKVLRALDTIRITFPFDLQMSAVTRFVAEPTHTTNSKVKEAVLNHLEELISTMNPSDLSLNDEDVDDDDTQTLLNVIIRWAMETKPTDARKSAQKVIISMFNLSPPALSLALTKQPKPSQDFVQKLLHSHLRTASSSIGEDDDIKAGRNCQLNRLKGEVLSVASHLDTAGRSSFRKSALPGSRIPLSQQRASSSVHFSDGSSTSSGKSSADERVRMREPNTTGAEQLLQANRMSEDSGIYFGPEEAKDELSPESSNLPVFSPQRREIDFDDFGRNPVIIVTMEAGGGENSKDLKENYECDDKISSQANSGNHFGPWSDVMDVFSNSNSSEEERKQAMKQLIRTLPNNYEDITDDSLQTMLPVLLLTSGGTDEVSELADECISLLLKTRTARGQVKTLKEVAEVSEFPINLEALKMLHNELQTMSETEVHQILPELVPSLIMAYENNESRVRKASLLSLVHLYKVIGEKLWTHIKNINDNKKNLLAMYFKRAEPYSLSSTSST